MHRRRFIALLAAAITAARTLRAQQKAMPVIGWLYGFSPPANPDDLLHGPVHQGLSETGFVEGQNMTSEYRWADFHYDRLPALAADLVSRKVDLILTLGGAPPALAAKNATSTIPIVFTDVGDLFREAGRYAGRILKGAKPADLSVPQPTTFKLVVNLKTAKALGLTIPLSILARADEVIE
jgi:ABC-type uncharacterized transport system substrate-binding protein